MKIISLPDANSSSPQSVTVVPVPAKTEQLVMKSKMDMNVCAHQDTRELIVMVCIFSEGRVLPIWLKVTKVKRLFIQLVFNFISFKLDDKYCIFLIYPQVQLHNLIFSISSFKRKFVRTGCATGVLCLIYFIIFQTDLCFVSFLDSFGRNLHQSKGFSIRFQSMIA